MRKTTLHLPGLFLLLLLFLASAANAQAWSPDGKKLAYFFFSDNEDIYIIGVDGTGHRRLTTHEEMDFYPQWHPNGGLLAFTSKRDGHFEIYSIKPDGSALTRITAAEGDYNNEDPSWSPDGTQIAFISDRRSKANIFIMNADGTDQKPLSQPQFDERSPRWSPDGKRIAFVDKAQKMDEIFILDIASGKRTNITNTPDVSEFHHQWSPDGKRLVFVGVRDSIFELYSIASDGTYRRQITHEPEIAKFAPHWSPDGTKIAYFADEGDDSYGVFVISVEGGKPERIGPPK